jgi:hypothetical protein
MISGRFETIVPGFDVERVPEGVVTRMVQHVGIPGRESLQIERVERLQRQMPQPSVAQHPALLGVKTDRSVAVDCRCQHATADVHCLSQVPAEPVVQIERPTLEHHVVPATV